MRYLGLLVFLMVGCSHYLPILPHYHQGQRHQQKLKLSSCANYVLGLTNQMENMTYATALDKLKLQPQDVFSVDVRHWFWAWPFYSWSCLEINVNDSYQAPPLSGNSLNPGANRPLPPPPPPAPSPVVLEPGMVSGNLTNDLASCDKLKKKEATTCKKMIKRQYDALEKATQ